MEARAHQRSGTPASTGAVLDELSLGFHQPTDASPLHAGDPDWLAPSLNHVALSADNGRLAFVRSALVKPDPSRSQGSAFEASVSLEVAIHSGHLLFARDNNLRVRGEIKIQISALVIH